jgi:hypothetical protein
MRRALILEAINLLIVLYFFQDALFKIVYWDAYGAWLRHVPLFRGISVFFKFAIPVAELAFCFGMVFGRAQFALSYAAVFNLFLAIIQILAGCIFNHHLPSPFHLLWFHHLRWFNVLLADLVLAWLILGVVWMKAAGQRVDQLELSH